MRFTAIKFGLLTTSALVLSLVPMAQAHALESASFLLLNENADSVPSTSSNFTMEGGIDWTGKPLSSGSFQIVSGPVSGAGSSSSSSTTSSSSSPSSDGEGSGGTGGIGSGGGSSRPPVASSSSSSVSSQSSTSSASSPSGSGEPSQPGTSSSSSSSSGIFTGPVVPRGTADDLLARQPSFFDGLDACAPLHAAPPVTIIERIPFRTEPVARLNDFLLVITGGTTIGLGRKIKKDQVKHMRGKKKPHRRTRIAHGLLHGMLLWIGVACIAMGLGMTALSFTPSAQAAASVPQMHVYNGHLLDSSGNAVTTAHTIRFSYWLDADLVAGDVNGAGAINTGAATYAGWTEVHTFTPNAQGYFSVNLGSVTSLPDLSTFTAAQLQGLFLQVEVKASAAADTAYEVLDPDGDDGSVDRTRVMSVPFSLNADTVDKHDVGTGSGAIPFLQSGGLLPVSTMPGGTNRDEFIIDADDSSGGNAVLQFGNSLSKTLSYDSVNGTFRFNDDLRIEGNLTISGLVNGVDITNIQSSTGALKAFSGGGLNLNVSQGSYRLRGTVTDNAGATVGLEDNATNFVFFGSGGITSTTTGFPVDESFIPVAQVTTLSGSIQTVSDKRVLSSDDREQTVSLNFNPAYEKAAYQGDGTNNVGQLLIDHDNISLNNFYKWTSTRGSLQDYDILLRVSLGDDFVRWKTEGGENPLSVAYRSTSADTANNALDIQVYDTNGTPVTLSGSVTGLAGTSWTTQQIEFTGSPTWTAGQEFLIRMRVYAKDDFQMHIGKLRLQYVELKND